MTSSVNEVSVQLPIVLTDDEAAQIAEKFLYRAWTEREQFEFQLPFKYIGLDAGDVVQIDLNGHVHIIRITKADWDLPGVIKCQGVSDRASVYTSSVTGGAANYPTQTLVLIGDTVFEVMDLPALRAADLTTAGYYLAMYGKLASWTGGLLYRSIDAGSSWSAVASKTTENTMGTSTNALGSFAARTWDMVNSVNVSMGEGTLTSDTSDNILLNKTNTALLGDEIIAFMTATLEGNGTYTLTGLLRGLAGTEWAIGTHTTTDRFVLLDTTKIARVETTYSQIGATPRFKAVSNGQIIDSVTAYTDVTMDNLNSKPYSVVHIAGTRDGSNNLTISWIRRSRAEATMLWTPVLQEDSEQYQVHVMSGTNIVRILTASTNSAAYTAAQQTLDGFTPGNPITVKIYQVSATVGLGYESEQTI
jgi:hypothetical protein